MTGSSPGVGVVPHPVDILQEVLLVPGEPVVVLLAAALVLVGQGVQGGHVHLGHLGGGHALGQVELEAGQGVSQVPGGQEGGGRRRRLAYITGTLSALLKTMRIFSSFPWILASTWPRE